MYRQVLLIEPNYRNKYPPMGLMKIATYFKRHGDNVRFFKGDLLDLATDLICEDLLFRLRALSPDTKWNVYIPALRKYVRNGKNNDIPDTGDFEDDFIRDAVKEARNKFKFKDYFKNPRFDIVGITTLFTFHWGITIDTINFAKQLCKDQERVYVGGVASTILPEEIEHETGIKPTIGILDKPGVYDEGDTMIVDTLPLDYSILEEIDYKYPATAAYFAYMTRGCPNKCPFCAVPTLEPEYQDYLPIKEQLERTKEAFGEQRNLLLLDNNVLASRCFDRIIDEIKECGFERNASYVPENPYEVAIRSLRAKRNNRAYIRVIVRLYGDLITKSRNTNICKDEKVSVEIYKRIVDADCLNDYTATREAILALDEYIAPLFKKYAYRPLARQRYVDFNQGVDARLITPENMRKLAEINIRPLRIAFDHWDLRETYEKAVRTAAAAGIKNLSNYMLYNFNEKPEELFLRMKLTVDLCDELGIAIYSFPMKYHPISDPKYFRNRDFIGKKWNKKYVRAVQAVLTSTHGKIGRGKQFFEAAFGKDVEEYYEILTMPEALIIKRFEHDEAKRIRFDKEEEYTREGSEHTCDCVADEWREKFNALTPGRLKIALPIIYLNKFADEDIATADPIVNEVLRYYQIHRDDA
jgi:hypothetical protein